MKKQVFYWLTLVLVLAQGCKKEESFEVGNTPSQGSLQSDVTGDCLPKTVNGVYVATTPLIPATNTITITINVTRTGTYLITTDTVNGYYFRGTGTFTTLGNNNVTLRSNGTPFTDGIDNFIVSYNGTICDIAVEVLPAGSGGPAVFTLVSGGSPVNCASAVVSGTYITNAALDATHYVDIQVNVTQIGTYSISATGGGMTFSKLTAAFTATGVQTVRLTGSGTAPAAPAAVPVNFTSPSTPACSFTVTVAAPVTGTLGGAGGACTPITPTGTYTQGVVPAAGNTVQVQITTAAVGPYSVTTNTIGGLSFSASGTSTGAAQMITLQNNGVAPTVSGLQTFTVTFGTSTCTFTITIAPPITGTLGGAGGACTPITPTGTYTQGVVPAAGNTVQVQITTSAVGPYSVTTNTIGGLSFSASGTSTGAAQMITLQNNGVAPTVSGPQTFTVTFGTSTCTFTITIGAAAVIDWSFNIGATNYSGSQTSSTLDNTLLPPYTFIDLEGSYGAVTDAFYMFLGDPGGSLMGVGETYKTDVVTLGPNVGYFYLDNLPGMELEASDPADTPGALITFTISTHNTTTKTITGTFLGTAYDHVSSTIKNISGGTFKIVYP